MDYIRLASPEPRDEVQPHSEFQYQFAGDPIYLATPSTAIERPFVDVLEGRQSMRSFGQLPFESLSTLLWYSAHTYSSRREVSGFLWQHRAAPSAGGRHPIDILVVDCSTSARIALLYDPVSHSMRPLSEGKRVGQGLYCLVDEIVAVQQATMLWFVAQPARTVSKYLNAESLVWRDVGALLAVIVLVAEALGLNCCPIGATGDPWLSAAIECDGALHGAGGCLVGSPVYDLQQC